jgi:membrane fusion protein, multidrug efflux system
LPETFLNQVEVGMELAARSAAFPKRVFPATVRTIETRIDPVTRAATIRAHIDNPDLILRPGMLLTVRLMTAERLALMVPEDALVQRSNDAFVYTVEEQSAQMRQVTHGARRDGWVEILAGLTPGEPVITEGVIKVRPGAPVRVQEVATPDPEVAPPDADVAPLSARRGPGPAEPG